MLRRCVALRRPAAPPSARSGGPCARGCGRWWRGGAARPSCAGRPSRAGGRGRTQWRSSWCSRRARTRSTRRPSPVEATSASVPSRACARARSRTERWTERWPVRRPERWPEGGPEGAPSGWIGPAPRSRRDGGPGPSPERPPPLSRPRPVPARCRPGAGSGPGARCRVRPRGPAQVSLGPRHGRTRPSPGAVARCRRAVPSAARGPRCPAPPARPGRGPGRSPCQRRAPGARDPVAGPRPVDPPRAAIGSSAARAGEARASRTTPEALSTIIEPVGERAAAAPAAGEAVVGSLVETASGVRRTTPTGSGTAASRSAGRSRTARARARARAGPLGGRPRAARLLGPRPWIAGAVHDDAVGAGEPGGEAPLDHALEALAPRPAVAEAPVAALREGRAVRHPAVEAEAAEPPAGEVRIDLPAQPACGADVAEAAHPRHPQRTLGVDRGPPARPGRRAPPSPRGRTTARGPHPPGSRRGPAGTRSSSRTSRDTAPRSTRRPIIARSPAPSERRESRRPPRTKESEGAPGSAPRGGVGAPAFGEARAGRAAVVGQADGVGAHDAGGRLRRQGASRDGPLVAGLEPERACEADDGGVVREDADAVRAALDLAVRALERIGARGSRGQRSRGKSSVRPGRPRARRPSSSPVQPSPGRAARGAHGPPRPTASRRPPCSASGEDGLERCGDRAAVLGPDRGRGVCGPVDAASPRRRGVRPAPPRPAGPCGRPRSTGFTPRRPRSATPRRSFVRDGPPPPRGRGLCPAPLASGPGAARREAGPGPGPPAVLHRDGHHDGAADGEPSRRHRFEPDGERRPRGPRGEWRRATGGAIGPRCGARGAPPALVDLGAEPAHPALRDARAAHGARRRSPAARVETPRR